MRALRLLFISITILLLFSNIVFSQSSIYQDAKDLAKMVREKQIPIFDFSKTWIQRLPTRRNGIGHIALKYDGKEIQLNPTIQYVAQETGVYKLQSSSYPGPLGSSDTLQLIIGDSIVNIIGDSSLLSVTLDFSPTKTIIYRSELGDVNGQEIYSSEGNFIKMLEILNAQINFKSKKVGERNFTPFENVARKYSTNPFFDKKLKTQIQLSENSDRFIQKNINYFSNKSQKKYDWEKLMYGDSVLQFEKTISFQDLSTNYRDPITSKNELDIANTRINESSRNKGFLDAKTVAVGLSDFIAERAQEELNLTFFHRFKENLDQPSELTVLFPNTKKLLYQFEISNYKTLLSHARESFTVDLDNMGLNFPKVLELDKYKDLYDNSPDVFNLALIYSIADLAYREVPVEQILIAGYKKLEGRQIELGKSINNKLGYAILYPKTEDTSKKKNSKKPQKKINSTLPKIVKGAEIATLQNHVDEYLTILDTCQNGITRSLNSFSEMLPNADIESSDLKENKAYQNIQRTSMRENYSRYYHQLRSIGDKNDFFSGALIDHLRQKGKIIYLNQEIKEDSILNFYHNTISANLHQKEYFDYLLKSPSIQEYDLVFNDKPKSKDKIVAQGFAGIRNLIEEDFDELLWNKLENLKTYAGEARTIKGELLRLEKLNKGVYDKISGFINCADYLKLSIDEEIKFWEKVTGDDKSNQEIAALYYLKALTESDDYINLFRTVEAEGPDRINYYVNGRYYNTLGLQFQGTLKIGNERLDSIQFKFTEKTNQLKNQYGYRKINPELYNLKLSSADLIEKKEAIDQLIKKEEDQFITKRNALEGQNETNIKTDPALQKLVITMDSLNTLSEAINKKSRDEDRELTEEENNSIEQLATQSLAAQNKQNQIEEKFDKELTQSTSLLIKNRDSTIAALQLQKQQLNDPFSNLKPITNTAVLDSFPKLNDVYDLSKNTFLQKYEEEKIKQTQIDSSQFKTFNTLDETLKLETKNLIRLKQKKQELNNYLAALENEYCENLVSAKDNAKNLSKGLELSTHILLAFRDYENISKPITYSDTSRIVLTKNKIDATKGFVLGTATLDSLDIQEKIIKETSIDTTIARWITFEKFDSLRKDPLEWNLFLGLLYQRLSSIEGAPQFSAQGTALLTTKFFNIANDMEETRTKLRIKKANHPSEVNFKDYYPFIRSTVDLFNTLITTQSIGDFSLQHSYPSLKNIPLISNQALSLYENIYVKEYGNAILNSMELLKIITAEKLSTKEQRQSTRAINAVLIYGTFMANMINAKTSDQVKNIMKSATLPPGSSRIKRETTSSFTINSYLGVGIGRDRLLDIPANIDLDQDAFGASLSVPIGFTYSFSPNIIKNNSSFSIHVPLLDLGAITAYRQNPKNANYSIDNLPDFSWNNLFSPGAFVVYNFANSPFSLGVGGQYGPQLREIKLNTGEAVNVNSWRFPMAFFTIDVPFFNLYTGSRKIIVK